jgi:hypothetical protein
MNRVVSFSPQPNTQVNQKRLFNYGEHLNIICADSSPIIMMFISYLKIEKYPNLKKDYAKSVPEGISLITKTMREENRLFHLIML